LLHEGLKIECSSWAGRQQQQCKKTDNRVLCRIRIHVRIPFTEQPEPEKTFADHAEVAII
jgi:hypothetical protein